VSITDTIPGANQYVPQIGAENAACRQLRNMAQFARSEWAEPAASKIDETRSPIHRAANSATIISVVVIGVVSLVGILIFSQIMDALPEPENEQLADSTTEIATGFGSAMELVPIVLLVIIATLVISVVQRMRGLNGR